MDLSFSGGYQQFWHFIVRPPKDEYSFEDLGPKYLTYSKIGVCRTDFILTNKRGLRICCSHFDILPEFRPTQKLPCVIFLHGNSSSRLEGMTYLEDLIPQGITLLVLDFSGCGQSEGEYISLGWFERDDVEAAVAYLQFQGGVSLVGLWGRSMGAATAIMFAGSQGKVSAIAADSPFANLTELCRELCLTMIKIPSLIIKGALRVIKNTIQKEVGFDIYKNNPKDFALNIRIPVLIIHGAQDEFIPPHHSHTIVKVIPSQSKNIKIVEGDHNTPRDKEDVADIVSFFVYHLKAMKPIFSKNTYTSPQQEKPQKNAIFDSNHLNRSYFENRRQEMGIQSSMYMSKIQFQEKDIMVMSKETLIQEKEDENAGSNYPMIDDSKEFKELVSKSLIQLRETVKTVPKSNSYYPSLD